MSFTFECVQQRVDCLLNQLELIAKQLKEIEDRIAKLHAEVDPNAASRSLPGFGKHISAVVDSAVGDITRFSSGVAFSAYIRCVPRENSTGDGRVPDGEHKRQPLRKDGNRYLQSHFYLAAEVARRYDAECANIYVNLMAKGRHHKQAIIAVARRLGTRHYALKMRQQIDPKASYEFRDLHGRPITKREAKVIADRLNHARKENKKKASSARKTQKPSATKPDSPIPESLGNILLKLAAGLGVEPHRLETQIGNLLPNQKQIKRNNEKSKNTLAIT